VVVRETKRAAAVALRPDPLGPATSLVLRSADTPAPAASAPESLVFALADGFLYALDGSAGAPLWHIPVGLSSPFVPRVIPGDRTLIAFDARHNDLLRLDADKGTLRWRIELGEPIFDPPLILGNQVIQVVPGGRILFFNLESGELSSTIDIGRPLSRTPVADDAGRLYVMGRSDCLFVLEREPFACVLVDYLGHADGSIPCAPARLGPYLVVPENDRLDRSLWHILVIESEGKHIRPAQRVEVPGWTWQTPPSSGAILWALGDRGGYEAFAIGEEKSKVPFRAVARQQPDAMESGPVFALARTERELWVASGHSAKLALDPERAAIETKVNIVQPGPALAPPQLVGNHVVLSFQDQATDGVALWAFDAVSGQLDWKTILGAPWQPPLVASADGLSVNTFGRNGRPITLSESQIERGGFVVETLTTPGQFLLPAGSRIDLPLAGKPGTVIVPPNHSRVIWVQDQASSDGWRKVELSSPVAANPVAVGEGLFMPGLDARANLIDPLTARSLAEPFVRRFDRDRQGNWYAPASLDLDTVVLADDMGRLNRVALEKSPVARLAGTAEAVLDQKVIAPPAVTGGAVIVVTADRKIRALAGRDLSPLGSWPLEAPLAGPIQEIPNGCLVMDRAGGVAAFGRDGARKWSIKLGSQAVGVPLVRDQTVTVLTADGTLHVRALADGAERERRPLDVAPVAGPLSFGKENIVIPVGRGSIRRLLSTTNPGAKP
jgi:outer membrane protein assembly factor BamB